MKIGITCYPVYGGSGVVATELGIALAARGHEIHFISYALPFRLGKLAPNIFFHEVDVTSYPLFEYPPYSLTLTSKMASIAKHEKLDVLHVHYAIPHATSAVIARQILEQQGIRIPVVTTLHGTDITIVGRDPSFAPVVTYSINQSDGVTAVSEYLRKETLSNFEIDRNISVIPNFIDTNRFKRQESSSLKQKLCPNCEKVLVHVSNFRPVKNAKQVVEIMHRLKQDNYSLKLLLVGDGPDRVPAEHLARELGIYDDILFMGKQEAVQDILSIADVFVMPSGSETFGLAALEAMACGVPVVASNIGGLPELVDHGENGFLCPLGNVDAFAERIRQIVSSDTLQQKMGDAARQKAKDYFDNEHVIPLYEKLYEKTLVATQNQPNSQLV
ncbi:MAG: N-acetyl-alpha-D-glucosaminyl L-malate synthase BshA [Rhodothermaceae bacterium]|nr:N-acetyl-alpha-D-glucosaminyl L-malate synthase BshA [Rhodothermaceae bacterium]